MLYVMSVYIVWKLKISHPVDDSFLPKVFLIVQSINNISDSIQPTFISLSILNI